MAMTFEEAKKALQVAEDLLLLAAIGPPVAARRQMQREAMALKKAAQKVLRN